MWSALSASSVALPGIRYRAAAASSAGSGICLMPPVAPRMAAGLCIKSGVVPVISTMIFFMFHSSTWMVCKTGRSPHPALFHLLLHLHLHAVLLREGDDVVHHDLHDGHQLLGFHIGRQLGDVHLGFPGAPHMEMSL